MMLIELITVLALLQYLLFGALVARARGQYEVQAPATTGHPIFERHYRVQLNTLELLVAFIPALWLSTRFWSPLLMGGVGALFIVGRAVYARSYVKDPASRGIGFTLSLLSIVVLLLGSLAGIVLAALHGA
jgi:glutathione S-transferase